MPEESEPLYNFDELGSTVQDHSLCERSTYCKGVLGLHHLCSGCTNDASWQDAMTNADLMQPCCNTVLTGMKMTYSNIDRLAGITLADLVGHKKFISEPII